MTSPSDLPALVRAYFDAENAYRHARGPNRLQLKGAARKKWVDRLGREYNTAREALERSVGWVWSPAKT